MGFFASSGILNRRGFFEGSAFSPKNIKNLFFWFDASDEATLFDSTTGGSNVTTNSASIKRWEDKSGNSRHITENINPPILSTNSQNGKNCISFNGTSSQLTTSTNYTISGNVTVFCVTSRQWTTNAYSPIFSSTSYSQNSGLGIYASTAGAAFDWNAGEILILCSGYDSTKKPRAIGSPTSLTDNKYYLIQYSAGLSECKVLLNLSDITRVSNIQSISSINSSWRMGEAAASRFDGKIAEFIFFDRKLDLSETYKINNYLNSKWSIY